MNFKRLLSILFIIVLSLTLCSCKNNGNTGSVSKDGDFIQVDITPADPDSVASAAADYKPSKNYNYEKSDTTIADDEVKADGYILSNKEDEEKPIATVYFEQSDANTLEIDVLAKGTSDSDLDESIKLVKELILATFENFPFDELDEEIPFTTEKIKALVKNNQSESIIIYGETSDLSVGYEYDPHSGMLFFRIEM